MQDLDLGLLGGDELSLTCCECGCTGVVLVGWQYQRSSVLRCQDGDEKRDGSGVDDWTKGANNVGNRNQSDYQQ